MRSAWRPPVGPIVADVLPIGNLAVNNLCRVKKLETECSVQGVNGSVGLNPPKVLLSSPLRRVASCWEALIVASCSWTKLGE